VYHPGFLIAELGLAGTLENLERKPMGLDATDTRIQQIGYLLTCIENLRSAIKEYSNWPTIPQLYIKQEFVGGCDITTEMAQSGELQKLLSEKGLIK
jgi:hypothetical protein